LDATESFIVTNNDAAKRLDVYVSEKLPGLTRSAVKNLLVKALVLVDGKPVKASHRMKEGESVLVTIPVAEPAGVEPEDIPLEIIHEDDDIVVVNKEAGMAVHPGSGRKNGTLVNALVHHTTELASTGAPLRPGIVHRLDKDTSGVIVIAKNDRSYLSLSKQFRAHTTTRHYHALVWGAVKEETGSIDMAIGRDTVERKKISARTRRGRRAVTHYRVVKRFGPVTLLEVTLETGRTHQVRVHLSAIKHPVVGDRVYGRSTLPPNISKPVGDEIKRIKYQCLHALSLGFVHPSTGAYAEFTAPYPEPMERLVKLLESRCS
jgi:23S rRNA pseudouridine1911/1915/1917 synthase